MKKLNIYNRIQIELKQRGVKSALLLEELTDHYMVEYEVSYEQDNEMESSIKKVMDKMDTLNLKKLNMETNMIRNKRWIQVASMLLIIMISVYLKFGLTQVSYEPPSIWPVEIKNNNIAADYGLMTHPILKKKKFHKGIDIPAKTGDPVYATSDGIVSTSDDGRTNYGKFIVVDHDKTFQSKYCHLSKLMVKEGDEVIKGQLIGLIGSTGLSTSPHLHYEVLKNGENVNPNHYL